MKSLMEVIIMQSFKDFTKQLSQTHPQQAFSNFHLDISNIVATLKIDQEVTETGLEVEIRRERESGKHERSYEALTWVLVEKEWII